MPDFSSHFAGYLPGLTPHPAPAFPVLVQARHDDVHHLAVLQTGIRGGTVSQWADRIARTVDGERSAVVLARVDGELAGYANVALLPENPDDGAPSGYYLTGVTVAVRWRRRGIGKSLTRWRMAWAWQRASEVWCFVSAQNRASLDLHDALGFAEVRRADRLQGVSFDCGEGVLLRAHPPR
ncbi:GNAT family N-acetyltransferase [Streptomyces sp. TG1A-8]|uniref:GNAT family N-acetyltransferase n=1 Tax=Streptomyces sp. TG1A-8 TaxID=3051385 RepID=UPI00265B73D1|nr:GNAT family N-acetyltransferase [Streptomyces sp. TG1A-8]MDO0924059.1 GNAT family N-acetyltransferase [Streptomyces sp. TG1A-8]